MSIATPRIGDLDDSSFDPYLADEVIFGDQLDPYARIAELRAQGPVLPIEYRAMMRLPPEPIDPANPRFTVLSHAAVEEVLNHPELYSNRSFEPTLGVVFGPILSVLIRRSTRYRKLLQQAFRPQIVQTWGDTIVVPVVHELINRFRGDGRARQSSAGDMTPASARTGYIHLGRSRLRSSGVCRGAVTRGHRADAATPEGEARRVIDTFLDAGHKFSDTADIYGGGRSEEVVGRPK